MLEIDWLSFGGGVVFGSLVGSIATGLLISLFGAWRDRRDRIDVLKLDHRHWVKGRGFE
jgi:hypothetical protein